MTAPALIHENPAQLLQNLIRFDTSNPPGNERLCIEYINSLLLAIGFETTLIARNPERPNLITRIKGQGMVPPLLLYGHLDVIPTQDQKWSQPPFEARIKDGFIWGRGALDMKHGIAMYLAALLKAKAEKQSLPGDVLLAVTVDEEVASEDGARFLVEQHPLLFENVRYAFSEFGGFNMTVGGKRFYPIQIAEKQVCPTRIIFRGAGGHGAYQARGGAMIELAKALQILNDHSLPVHITQPVQQMIGYFAKGLDGLTGPILRRLLNPLLSELILKLMGTNGTIFSPLLHNTANPTMLAASDKRNVIPSKVVLDLDGRILPGFSAVDLKHELQVLLGKGCDIETHLPDPGPGTSDMGLFGMLAGVLRDLDPHGIPVPYVNPAVTDARLFSRLGIQTYGFTPIQLPSDFNFTSTIHAADERIPVEAMDFGTRAVGAAIRNFHLLNQP